MYTDTRACLLHLGVELPRVEKTSLASVPFYLARAVVLLPVWFGSFGACGGAYWLCGCCWLCAWACCAPPSGACCGVCWSPGYPCSVCLSYGRDKGDYLPCLGPCHCPASSEAHA